LLVSVIGDINFGPKIKANENKESREQLDSY